MNINIFAPGHPNFDNLLEYYTGVLQRKFNKLRFVKNIDVYVSKTDSDENKVAIKIQPEKGGLLFSNGTHKNENTALNTAIKKLRSQIEKYKTVHYKRT